MANSDGSNPGDDTGAKKTGGEDGDANGNAGDDATKNVKAKTGAAKSGKGGDGDDDGNDEPKLQLTQKELDAMIETRLSRARKKAEDDAKLTKEQLLEKERDDALLKVRDADSRDAFITAAGIDYAKGSRLFRFYKDDIEFDKAGKPENLKTVIETAKKEFP